jgi:type VI secretion system FHA domain protein
MPLQLKIVSVNRDLIGDDAERVFGDAGGTIGRSLKNDWILPDPDRYVSGRHASIDYKGGIYYVLDHSSNGVYINDEIEPIGKGNPRRLFDGDYIRMGDFEFAVSVDDGESICVPPESDTSMRESAADNLQQFVDEDSHRTQINLLDEEEITGDAAFQNALFGNAAGNRAQASDAPTGAANDAESADAARHAPAGSKPTPTAEQEIFNAFMEGLCISPSEVHPSTDRIEMMKTAGSTMRELIFGIISLLTSRSNLKNSFHIDQTTVLPRHNNPLKFSRNTDDLLMQLLLGTEGDYLGASDAIREVCQDLLFHQNAFLDAMNIAFIEFADRFDPIELADNFDRTMGRGPLFAFLKKSKYWDLYSNLYPIMTEKGGGRFPQMFGDEFVRAYERQVADYRRHDREAPPAGEDLAPAVDPGLLETRRLEPADRVNPVRRAPADGAGRGDDHSHEKTVEIHPLGKIKA